MTRARIDCSKLEKTGNKILLLRVAKEASADAAVGTRLDIFSHFHNKSF